MNICWVVTPGVGGHVRDVDAREREVLLSDGYEELRLVCTTPSATREGLVYAQAGETDEALASHVEMGGLALFGGCTAIQVFRRGSTSPCVLPRADLESLMRETDRPRT